MLYQVEVRTDQGALLTLPLQDVTEGFIIEDIQGLDPVKATIVSSSFAQMDGEQYQSSKREKRNIVIQLALSPDYADQSVQGLRNRLYGFFMPKRKVMLRFYSLGGPTVDIEGRIESFDSPRFAKDPTATISILCLNPDFYNPTPVVKTGITVGSTLETNLEYEGTVETGFLFKLAINRTISAFTIYHRPANDTLRVMEFESAEPMVAGDVVSISTVPGNKYARLTRAGVSTSVLYNVSPHAAWTDLSPGTNKIRIFTEGTGIPYSIEYTTKFGGL